jgi:hypothetical protein
MSPFVGKIHQAHNISADNRDGGMMISADNRELRNGGEQKNIF